MCGEHQELTNYTLTAADGFAAATATALFDHGLVSGAAVVGGDIRVASAGLVSLLGGVPLVGTAFLDHVAEIDRPRLRAALEALPGGSETGTIACGLVHPDGREFPVELRVAPAVIQGAHATLLVVQDLTERVAAEQRLRAIAHYDTLTDLPNRILLQDRLTQGLAAAGRNARMLALLVIDLDGFKAVNDAHGHAFGDAVLREAAHRIGRCIRSGDTLARVGGDEFVAVLPELSHGENAGIIAARMVNALRTPIGAAPMAVRIGASIGIAIFPDDGAQIEMLFARADAAMYSAKRAGRNQYAFADGSATVVLAADRCEWSAQWHLGNAVMDSDHEALFTLLNDLGGALAGGIEESRIQARLRRLFDFCARHFADEERIMSASRYAGLEGHRAEHQRLLADLGELAEHTHWVGASLTMRHLKNWLVGHIQSYDRAAARALAATAVERSPDAA